MTKINRVRKRVLNRLCCGRSPKFWSNTGKKRKRRKVILPSSFNNLLSNLKRSRILGKYIPGPYNTNHPLSYYVPIIQPMSAPKAAVLQMDWHTHENI